MFVRSFICIPQSIWGVFTKTTCCYLTLPWLHISRLWKTNCSNYAPLFSTWFWWRQLAAQAEADNLLVA